MISSANQQKTDLSYTIHGASEPTTTTSTTTKSTTATTKITTTTTTETTTTVLPLPEIQLQVMEPQGLRAWIEDTEGKVQYLAFHMSINSPLNGKLTKKI